MSTENEIKIKRGELIEEYKFLRAEILFMLRKESDYTKFVFTFIIAAITLAYKMEEPTAYFIPLIMSMLIQRQVLVIRETIVKIGAYIYVFLEPEINIKWETRNFNTVNSSDTITKRVLDSPRHLFWSVIHIFIMFLYVCKGSFRIEELNNFLCDMSVLELITLIGILMGSFFLTYKGYMTRELKIKYINSYSKIKSKENFGELGRKL